MDVNGGSMLVNSRRMFGIVCAILFAASGAAFAQDSLSIRDAIVLAIKNAPSITRASALADAAHARTDEAHVTKRPTLSADAAYTRIDPTIQVQLPLNGKLESFSFAPNDNYEAQATLSQILYDFGRANANIAASQSNEKSALDNLDAIKSLVTFQVVQSYFGIITADQTIRIEEDQKKVLQSSLGISETREKQGTVTSLDVLSTQTRIAAIESQEADMRAAKDRQLAGLRRLLGMKPGTPLIIQSTPALPSVSNVLDSLLLEASAHRPELLLSKDAEESARLQIDAARLSNPPLLLANISAGVKDGYPPALTKPTLNWAGTVRFSYPILEGGLVDDKIAEAQANYVAAQAQTADLRRQIESEVETAKADIDANQIKLGLTQVQIQQAQRALEIADVRYKNGAATSLDYLTAQSALEQAQLQQVQTSFNYALSIFNLKRALGESQW